MSADGTPSGKSLFYNGLPAMAAIKTKKQENIDYAF